MAHRSDLSLGDPYDGFVRSQIKSGRFDTADDVLRAALQLMQAHEASGQLTVDDIRDSIIASRAQGDLRPADDVFARLEQKLRNVAG